MISDACRGTRRAFLTRMLLRPSLCFALLSSTAAMAAAQNFRLGVNYAELIPAGSLTTVYNAVTATDAQGAIYIWVIGATTSPTTEASYLIKLSGNQVVYQNLLAFVPVAMAVDPAGNVYLTSYAAGNYAVVKLGTDGATVEYTTNMGPNVALTGLAVDATGRAYLAGYTPGNGIQATPGAYQQMPASTSSTASNAFVLRLKPTGAIDYATYLGGTSQAYSCGIAVDASGSAFVTGLALSADFPTTTGAYLSASGIPNFNSAPFLVRLSADGSALIYSTFANVSEYAPYFVAVDSTDNAVMALTSSSGVASVVERFSSEGTAIAFSKLLPASSPGGLGVDAAGNTYVSMTANANFAAMNSLAPCETAASGALTVLDGNGNILQSTYIPGSSGTVGFALGADSTINVVGAPAATYTPTQQLSGSSGGPLFLTNLSQNPSAPVLQLACVANAASYDSAAISGGEIVSLFGQGLGPDTGTQPQTEKNGFPKQLAGVHVTFNGTPGPLLYVQSAQINAIAPWALLGATVNVCVVYNGSPTNCVARPVVNQHPGVFTLDGVYAAALNEDGSFNTASNPAQVGSTVSIFATGLGPINPPQPDGAIVGLPLPSNVLQAGVYWLDDTFFIGVIAISTTVSYGGPAPFEVAGVSQVNFVVVKTEYGGQAPFILQAGGPMSMGAIIEPGSNGFLVHVAGE